MHLVAAIVPSRRPKSGGFDGSASSSPRRKARESALPKALKEKKRETQSDVLSCGRFFLLLLPRLCLCLCLCLLLAGRRDFDDVVSRRLSSRGRKKGKERKRNFSISRIKTLNPFCL